MNNGYTKNYRARFDNPLYKNPLVWHYFDYCIGKANYTEKKIVWNGEEMLIERGSFITGRKEAASDTGLTEQNIRTAIKILINLKMIEKSTIKSTSKFSYITVCNYDKFQGKNDEPNQQINQQLTSNQPATNQQLTTTNKEKNIKKDKKDKNKKIILSLFDFWNLNGGIKHRAITATQEQKLNKALDNFSEDEIKKAFINYNTILNDPDSWLSHKWSLQEFCDRALEKMLDVNEPFKSYYNNVQKYKTVEQKNKEFFQKRNTNELRDFLNSDPIVVN